MLNIPLFRMTALGLVAMCLAIGGCIGKSQPTKFYTLSSISERKPASNPESQALDMAIGIGPVKMADYLNQSKIVTRGNGNQIVQAEFNQWSGSLKDNLTNVLAENVGDLLATDRIFIYPWRTYMPVDYQVSLDISRFDGQPGREVFLVARWIIIGAEEKELHIIKKSEIREQTDSDGYQGFVTAQSRALGRLSQEIAETLRTLVQREN